MNHIRAVGLYLAVVPLLVACGPAVTETPPTPTKAPSVATRIPTPEPAQLPLSARGPNYASKTTFSAEDSERENRTVSITVWYPAVKPSGASHGPLIVFSDLEPDRSGARVDPEYYRAQCPEPDAKTAAILEGMSAYGCGPADDWEAFAAGEAITASEDGLWQPITYERIPAVTPLACEGWWVFGARGLAAVDRPTLMIDGTEDELYAENALIYEHLGTPDKRFITFLG
jgi:hypothetical protein